MPKRKSKSFSEIFNGDCLQIMEALDDKSIDLIVTDPPYLFDNGGWLKSRSMGNGKSILGKKGGIFDTEGMIYSAMSQFGVEEIYKFLSLAERKMKRLNMYLFCSETQVPIYGMWARENKHHFGLLAWEKPLSIINKNRFSTNAEFVCRIYDNGASLNRIERNEYYNKVIHCPIVKGKDKKHPTQKPLEAVERFIMLSSNEGDIVLDPFMGSGTTGVSCKMLGRNFIGIEKEENYFNIAKERIENE